MMAKFRGRVFVVCLLLLGTFILCAFNYINHNETIFTYHSMAIVRVREKTPDFPTNKTTSKISLHISMSTNGSGPPEALTRKVHLRPTTRSMHDISITNLTARPNGRCKNCYNWKVPIINEVPEDFCAERNGVPIELLIIVVNRPDSRDRRDVFRKIYSGDPEYGDRIRLLFTFGKEVASKNRTQDELLLKEEYAIHKDIMIFDILVSYYGMSPLNFNTFHWATKKCRNAKFLVKVTDDVFLNIPGWLKTFEKFGATQLSDVHFGTCNYGTNRPIRDPKHRFYASLKQYPFKLYPSFCAGGGLFMSLEMTENVLRELSNLAIVTIFDDLNIGLALRLSGHCVCHIPGTYLSYELLRLPKLKKAFLKHEPKSCKDISFSPFLGLHLHSLSAQRMVSLWKLKHCYADRYPTQLTCQRRYTCKQDNFHVEPLI